MSKLKLTKNEFKKQKEAFKTYQRYLPMLQLKKKQLQLEIIKIHQAIKEAALENDRFRAGVLAWVDVFAEKIDLAGLCRLKEIKVVQGNVAGIDLPIFDRVDFQENEYDLLSTPLWVDKGILAMKEMVVLRAKILVFHQQLEILKEELRIANQRVNLFEKVKIPEAKENAKIIQIYLGELQTAEVVRGKIAKSKIERKIAN